MVDKAVPDKNKIISVCFNQDQGCFACGTESGFRIFCSYPFKDTFQREFDAGIKIVEMLFRTNILSLVGGGVNPKYPPNKVIIWDDHQMKCVCELSFKTEVRAVRLRKDRVVVVLNTRIYIYNFCDLKLLDTIDTCPNPNGLCAVSAKDTLIVISPDKKNGTVKITNYDENTCIDKQAHKTDIAAITMSQDARIFATASRKGTLVRVFSTTTGELLKELRRGSDRAEIHSIAFDTPCRWLACTSDKGTVHVFSLSGLAPTGSTLSASGPEGEENVRPPEVPVREEVKTEQDRHLAGKPRSPTDKDISPKNKMSMLKFMRKVFSYFGSEWSFAHFKIPEKDAVVAFGPDDKNCVIGMG